MNLAAVTALLAQVNATITAVSNLLAELVKASPADVKVLMDRYIALTQPLYDLNSKLAGLLDHLITKGDANKP